MANVFVNEQYLKDIADVIRKNNGTDNEYKPYEMADAVKDVVDRGIAKILEGNVVELYNDFVINLKNRAFAHDSILKKANLPNLNKIEERAFEECQIEEIIAPNVEEICNYAFYKCELLENADFPKVKTINDSYAFAYNSLLSNINMPKVTRVGDGAFYDCTSLKSVNLENVTELGCSAFSGCTSLVDVIMPNVEKIYYNAFRKTPIQAISLPNFKEGIGETDVYQGSGIFCNCTSLKQVDLPKLEVANKGMFNGCTMLETIYLPSLKTSTEYMFNNCSALKQVDLPQLETVTGTGNGMFYNCKKITEIDLPKLNTINNFNSFCYECKSLETIKIPNAIISKHSYRWYIEPFYNCVALKNITLKENSISQSIFIEDSPELSDESIQNIVNALAPITSNEQLRLHSSVLAKLTEEQLATIASKNWTVR